MKLELHTINKDAKNFDYGEAVQKQNKIQEESQKAIEIDFLKQNEKFRERLAMRKKHKTKILKKLSKESEWGNESSIKMDSMIKPNLSPDQSIELNFSDVSTHFFKFL